MSELMAGQEKAFYEGTERANNKWFKIEEKQPELGLQIIFCRIGKNPIIPSVGLFTPSDYEEHNFTGFKDHGITFSCQATHWCYMPDMPLY